ncbi:prion-inhibition and propagation-domain-containing protein [Xylogone sp. PMI_703]|nr:prion-inhibition and propagation-domain-containing protein [Xylogone sp. PMI_703]
MDPVSAAGIALSVASLAGQVLTGCIQGIQFIITAKNLPESSRYLNLRLRMEQQRLFAWSEASGLLDFANSEEAKIRESNTFIIHRTTILDLLVQIQCLFKEFEKAQRKNEHLKVASETIQPEDESNDDPAEDASSAKVPLPEKRRNFIMKAMRAIKSDHLSEGRRRLLWAAFDKEAFEDLLQRFTILNDSMTNILDLRLQTEIHRTTEDTHRGVLQLHKDLKSLQQLVLALNIKVQARGSSSTAGHQLSSVDDASGLNLLAQLAKFKAFNEAMETHKSSPWNEAAAMVLQLNRPEAEMADTKIDRASIVLRSDTAGHDRESIRCEGTYTHNGREQSVWIEWKEYEYPRRDAPSPPPMIIDRVQKLAALLRHEPKPEAFRVPHCLGYFDDARQSEDPEASDSDDDHEPRIGFVFEKPQDESISPTTIPISLYELLLSARRPRITDRIRLAHAIANCLLYLHSVNWLHKGLRSNNIVFFPLTSPQKSDDLRKIDYSKPYLSGFDFARPARADEMTEIPGDIENNMYRHPSTQGSGFGPREKFRKSFDIYSLGVVLVELAHWSSIQKILGIERINTRTTLRIRQTLLDPTHISEIGANMGEIFENATKICIAGGSELGIEDGDDETGDYVATKLSMKFYEEVVKKLADVKI